MGRCRFLVLPPGQRTRSISPALTRGYVRHLAASGSWLLVFALLVAGCGDLSAGLRTSLALHGAGYQNVSINVATGSGSPSGGLVSVSYSSGPVRSDQRDALRAEKIVWDTFAGHFGALAIFQETGGCAGPFCATQTTEVASATYVQLAARFGPRPHGLAKASPARLITLPGWAVALVVGLAVAVMAAAALVLILILRRTGSRPPDPPPWQP
jgi:hypothetical protein